MEWKNVVVLFLVGAITWFLLTCSEVRAVEGVVVVPLGGTIGNATPADVLAGKTFSSRAAGKGSHGALEIREGSTIYTNSIGMKFSLIPAGSFIMGSPEGIVTVPAAVPVWPKELGRDIDENQHIVFLTEPFYMQITEVTQGQWHEVMGSDPSYFLSCGGECPVEMVSWNDVQTFIDTLNAREGKTNCKTSPNDCYSLPTESQWEYAARAGTLSAFYSGDLVSELCAPLDQNLDKIGWYCGNTSTTEPVGHKEPNNWGLFDMSGNVAEWCQDLYGMYPPGPEINPTGATSGSSRVYRGGSYFTYARAARLAIRRESSQTTSRNDLGFRLILSPGQ